MQDFSKNQQKYSVRINWLHRFTIKIILYYIFVCKKKRSIDSSKYNRLEFLFLYVYLIRRHKIISKIPIEKNLYEDFTPPNPFFFP